MMPLDLGGVVSSEHKVYGVDGLRVEINEAGPAMRPRRRAVLRSGEEAGQEMARALQELDRGGHAGNDSLTPSPTAPVDAPGPTQRGPR